ncbi:hypothetical protein [Streptomyces sp. NPDC057877]|uniref:hypothetical protein n=1 Tax=Streptomyces sp. NPDC057877 TaxID=3346269 RepID=UPI0036778789
MSGAACTSKGRRLRRGLPAVAPLITGRFAAYTSVRPGLGRVRGPAPVGALLLGYGAADVVGAFAGGTLATRRPRHALPLTGYAQTRRAVTGVR